MFLVSFWINSTKTTMFYMSALNLSFVVIILLAFNFSISSCKSINSLTSDKSSNEKCNINVNDIIIDLNKLYVPGGYELPYEEDIFLLNICGETLKCGKGISICKITKENKLSLGSYGSLETLHKYHPIPGLKYSESITSTSGKKHRKFESTIEFKCNRYLTTPIIHYIPPNGPIGRKYHFVFETSFICLNLPTSCQVNNVENNFQYDLRPLRNVIFETVDGREVRLDICGNLKTVTKNHLDCLYEGTHVCLVNKQEHATNLGVFPTEWEFNDNGLTLTFTDGSLCDAKENKYIHTKIDLICSYDTNTPILLLTKNCEYHIAWNTPVACPYYESISSGCTLNDQIVGIRNLTMYSNEEQERDLLKNSVLKFNICSSLNNGCRGYKNVSFCLVNNKQETILGWTNTTITTRNGLVTMHLSGEICPTKQMNNTVNIELRCDYTKNKPEDIHISNDLCSMNMTIFTALACPDPEPKEVNCKLKSIDGSLYDLNQLALLDRNYEVRDANDSTVVYLLNVCKPVVFGANAMCDLDSAVCMRRDTEPDKHKRFKSLGMMTSGHLFFENNHLTIQYKGSFCHDAIQTDLTTTTTIQFVCVQHSQESLPELVSKNGCQTKFVWKTRHGCPATSNNLTNEIHKERDKLEARTVIIYSSEPSRQYTTTTDIIVKENAPEVRYNIINETFNSVKTKLQISATDSKDRDILTSLIVPINYTVSAGVSITNCSISDNTSNYNFNMSSFPKTFNISSISGRRYSLSMCSSYECSASTCVTDIHLTPTRDSIEMDFYGKIKCNDGFFNSVIFMKCSEESQPPSVLKEDECGVQLEWRTQEACSIQHPKVVEPQVQHHAVTGIVCGVVGLALALSGLGYLWWRRRIRRCVSPDICRDHIRYSQDLVTTRV